MTITKPDLVESTAKKIGGILTSTTKTVTGLCYDIETVPPEHTPYTSTVTGSGTGAVATIAAGTILPATQTMLETVVFMADTFTVVSDSDSSGVGGLKTAVRFDFTFVDGSA